MAMSGLGCRKALSGPFLSLLVQMGLENSPLNLNYKASFPAVSQSGSEV